MVKWLWRSRSRPDTRFTHIRPGALELALPLMGRKNGWKSRCPESKSCSLNHVPTLIDHTGEEQHKRDRLPLPDSSQRLNNIMCWLFSFLLPFPIHSPPAQCPRKLASVDSTSQAPLFSGIQLDLAKGGLLGGKKVGGETGWGIYFPAPSLLHCSSDSDWVLLQTQSWSSCPSALPRLSPSPHSFRSGVEMAFSSCKHLGASTFSCPQFCK